MQIKNVVIYKNKNTEPRIIPFNIGQVNIITGESKTGKTALIDIIDYCLGSKNCNIKGSVIRDTVTWFSITIQFENDQIFISRQNPNFLRTNTTSYIYFEASTIVTPPDFDRLIPNSNILALNRYISNKIGIDNNLNIPENNTRDSLEASFRHSRAFSFQPQNIIAEYKYLFFNQDDSFKESAMKDTLPYILGAIREDELVIRQKITIKNRQLNRLIREKKQEDNLLSKSSDKLDMFIDEAKEAELIDKYFYFTDEDDAINALNKINEMNISLNNIPPLGENEQLSILLSRSNKIKKQISKIDAEISAVNEYALRSLNYTDEAKSQKNRLLSIGLYKKPTDKSYWNSIIGDEVDYLPPQIQQINNSLEELSNNLLYTEHHKPKVQKIILELNEKKSLLFEEIYSLRTNINNIYKKNKEAEKYRNINILKGRTIGRISLFLESLEVSQKDSSLNIQIKQLAIEIKELKKLISNEERDNKLGAILNKINILMTSWNSKIDWEYQSSNLRFDIKKLTVFADTDEKSESLQQMGSGENWLACHLLIHFALHKHFIDKKRPVANFLIFDQPTQIHYPQNYKEENGVFVKSEDEKADEKMFKFIFEITKILHPNLQVIVMDHANFSNNDFQQSIVEEWRDGIKLVPDCWLKN